MLPATSVAVLGVLQLVSAALTPTPTPDNVTEATEWMLQEGDTSETSVLITLSDLELQVSCTDRRDGLYRHTDSCTIYYRCSRGRRQVYKCLDGFLFSANKLRCEPRANSTCDVSREACQLLRDGLHPNRSAGCQQFFRCESHNVKATYSCRAGLAFSLLQQACVPAPDASCVETRCSATESGYQVTPGTHCRAYYRCSRGVRTELLCPEGQVFERDKQACAPPTGPCFEPLCTGRINGLYADTSHGCTRAFHCVGGTLHAVTGCPAGKLHNGHACLAASSVQCAAPERTAVAFPAPAAEQCAGLADGSHAASDAHCRGYLLCRAGRTLAVLRCPMGLRFDGRRCSPAEHTPCASECVHLPDGYHVVAGSACRQYLYCLDGRSVARRTCAEGTIFNGYMCVPTPIYSCPSASTSSGLEVSTECSGLEDGFHIDFTTGCRDYFYCSSGRIVITASCGEDVWNGDECVSREKFMCDGPEFWPTCSALAEGLHQDRTPESQCRQYFHCAGGNRTRLSCPQNEVFDGHSCVSAHSYTCPGLEPDSCDQKQDGYYQDPGSGCRSYFYCSNGHKITYVCSGTFMFDGKQCVDPASYKCPFSSDDCSGRLNGYHYDAMTQCRKYFYCLEGAKITTLTCAEGKVFNGQRCVEPSAFQCPGEAPCAGRPDGLYIQPGSSCVRYMQCAYQKQVAVSDCPQGTVFDGAMCMPAASYTCTTMEPTPSLDCSNALNGFYQNFTSGCRSYFFCIEGMKTTLTCPGHELFNGQLCVDANSYTCPEACINSNSTACEQNIKTDCENYTVQYVFIISMLITIHSL